MRTLRPYQAEAVEYLLSHRCAALFMEMRLGKTLVVVRALQELDLPGCILVVAPMVGLWAWKRELDLEGIPHVRIQGSRDQRTALAGQQAWNIINYEALRATPGILNINWSAIVLDESRRIANPRAQITRLLQKFSNPCTRRILLSGNPAPEGPEEFFEQMRFLFGRFLGCTNFWQFRQAFFAPCGPYEWVPRPTAVSRIKAAVHSSAFMLTRKDAGISTLKIYERRTVQLKKDGRKLYEQILKEFAGSWGNKDFSTKWVPVQYMWLQQVASGFLGNDLVESAKFDELVSLLTGELCAEQVVVWFRFNSGLAEAERRLRKAGVTSGKILGEVVPAEREQRIDAFRAGRIRVLLCQIKAAKEAIDLSVASTAIYFSNSHSLDERVQSEDRILSTQKTDPLLYLDLVTEGTVDEDIVDLLQDKKVEARFFLSSLLKKLLSRRKP